MSHGETPGGRGPARRRRRRGLPWPAIAAGAVVLALLAWWAGPGLWERLRAPETPEAPPAAPAPAPPGAAPPPGARAPAEPVPGPPRAASPPAEPLPPLEESDAFVRERVAPVSPEPVLRTWLDRPGLIDRFVVAIDNVADGVSPRKHVSFLRPAGPYLVLGDEDGVRTDPASYRRYDAIVTVVESLDPDACAQLYRLLNPLFQQSFEALGYPDASFDDRFAEAVRELLRTPVPPREPLLEARTKRYAYADPRLEGLSDAQKQLLRLGPRGVRAVQAKLRAVASALAIEVK